MGYLLYNLVTDPSDSITGYSSSGSGFPLSDLSNTLNNKSLNLQTVKYTFTPILNYKGGPLNCQGKDTAITIYVNPTPRLNVVLSKGLSKSLDTICYNQGTDLVINTPNTRVIGSVDYTLSAIYDSTKVKGVAANMTYPVSNLPQNLVNISDSIQTVTYTFIPRIDNVNNGSSCTNGIPVNVSIKIVPEITYSLYSKKYNGNWNVSCADSTNGDIGIVGHPLGGLHSKGYTYSWDKGSTQLSTQDSIYKIGAGVYSVKVTDILGCFTTKIDTVLSPLPITPDVISHNLYCSIDHKGSINIKSISGGTSPYNYLWTNNATKQEVSTDDSITIELPGTYDVNITDDNGCIFKSQYTILENDNWMMYVNSVNKYRYNETNNIYEIRCYGLSDGALSYVPTGDLKGKLDSLFVIFPDSSKHYYVPTNTQEVDTLSGLKAGQYIFCGVKKSTECTVYQYDTTVLKQPNPVEITSASLSHYDQGNYNVQCYGGNNGQIHILKVTGGNNNYFYYWSEINGSGLDTLNTLSNQDSLTEGIYNLVVKDYYNCVADTSFKLNQPPPVIVHASFISNYNGYNIQCYNGNNGEIKLNSTGGFGGKFSYYWTTENGSGILQGDSVQANLTAGTYYANVSYNENNCSVPPDTFKLNTPPQLVINPGIYYMPVLHCVNDSDGKIDVNVYGGVPESHGYDYHWYTYNGSHFHITDLPGIDSLKIGTYYVNVTDSNKCSAVDSFVITQPDTLKLNIKSVNVSCLKSKDDGMITAIVTGGTRPYSYRWYQNGVLLTQDNNDSSLTAIPASSYEVLVNDYYNCKSDTSFPVITARNSINVTAVPSNYNGVNVSCYGSSNGYISTINLGGTAPYSYQWYYYNDSVVISTMDTLTNAKANKYYVKVSDSYGCKGDTSVTLSQPRPLRVNLSPVDIDCAGKATGSITVNASGGTQPYSYSWSNQENTESITHLTAGLYILTLTDANSCDTIESDSITQPPPIIVENKIKQPFCPDAGDGDISLDVSGGVPGYTYSWTKNGENFDFTTTGLGVGLYICTIDDATKNCPHEDTIKLTPQLALCLNIPNVFSPNGDGINDTWVITAGDPNSPLSIQELYPNLIVEIYSRWGTLLFRSEPGYPNPWNGTYNGNPLPIDSYYYIITLKSGEGTLCGNVTIVK